MDDKYTIDNNPLVSVIIPSFNRETLIGETLDSVLSQTYPHWECIIVDDGSSDNTIDIIKAYCQKDNRFRVYKRHRQPKGAPTCRNIGLDYANGNFLMFLDSDDILFSYALERRVAFFNINPGLDFCISDGLKGEFPVNENSSYRLISTYKSQDVLKEFLNFTPPWINSNPLFKKDALLNNNIYWDNSIKGYQDIDFHLNCVTKKLVFDFCEHSPDFLWRIHKGENVGAPLKIKANRFEQKVNILKKYSTIFPFQQKEFKVIFAALLKEAIFSNNAEVPQTIKKELLNLYAKYYNISNATKLIYKNYSWAHRNKIKFITGFFRKLILLKDKSRILNFHFQSNHFLSKEYKAFN